MPVSRTIKESTGDEQDLCNLVSGDDPEKIFIDLKEIGHGNFGAVYYVWFVNVQPFLIGLKMMGGFSPVLGPKLPKQWSCGDQKDETRTKTEHGGPLS